MNGLLFTVYKHMIFNHLLWSVHRLVVKYVFDFQFSILLFKQYFLSRSSQCIIFTDPNDQGSFVADENGSNEPLRKYSQKTLVIVLPGDLTVFDIGEQYLVVQLLHKSHCSDGKPRWCISKV